MFDSSTPQLPSSRDGDAANNGSSTGHMLAQLSNAMVRIYKEDFGRGPTRSVSYFAGPDAIVCVLRDSLAAGEQRLVEAGEHQRLRETRMVVQHASEDKFREAVQEITGRQVEAFVSGIDVEQDVSLEFFTLAPEAAG